ncbi:MAG: MerR family transcriptional regulator [Coriobacteriia bacterium]|nr:MerR family transcriptional regulator [Coriobacteriia bacterium]
MSRSRDYMTIGELVESLVPAHSDLTISKVRFLEDEGLITPERTAGGYRKFTAGDAARVDLVLRLQKENFLPLAVIREKLKDFDKGRVPEELRPMVTRPSAVALPFEDGDSVPLEDVPSSLGFPISFVRELAEYNLVTIARGESGDELARGDVEVAHTCWEMRRFGVEPRHLRMYSTFAEREAALFQQILMPAYRHRTPETRQKLVDSIADLTRLTDDVKRRLLKRAVGDAFEDVV